MLLIKLARTVHTSQTDQHQSVTMETEELYDDELIDEIADEVLLALEEELPDETYDEEVDQWAEACQAELAQLLDGAIGAAPPPAILTEPALPPNWDQVRDLLNKFFQKRVYDKTQTMNWDINRNLPRKGEDTEFDKLLQDQRIISNRRYQSQCCLNFGKQMVSFQHQPTSGRILTS